MSLKNIFKDVLLPVVSVEHLVAMKLFAIQNTLDRKFKDFFDIKEILRHTIFDGKIIKEYFNKYGQGAYYNEIIGQQDKD